MTNSTEQEGPDPNESGAGIGDVEGAETVAVAVDFAGESESATGTDPVAEIEKWKDVAARATADLDNFRKRMAREKFEAIQYANRGLLEQLLPIIDNFEMGLKAAESSDGGGSIILQGMAMVRKQLEDFLIEQGVEIIPSDGLAFDPNVHEALKQEPHDSLPEGHVIYTLRRGYRLKDRVLRAANVVVSSGPEPVS
jgi:molecular chaperone GrpE